MHSAIVVINLPKKHETEGQHSKWLTFLADTVVRPTDGQLVGRSRRRHAAR